MIIAVASGKGGTGKTTIAVHLASVLEKVCFLDCDVEEPNAHLFLKPKFQENIEVYVQVPEIDIKKCIGCGQCANVCAYHALAMIPSGEHKRRPLIFPHLCHACGACSFFCLQKAIDEKQRNIGCIQKGVSLKIDFVHGKMNVGEILSPLLIRRVKQEKFDHCLTIIDAPPGTACPVVAAIKGVDFCVLVTEPTPFGLHDLKLAVDVVRQLKISFGVVINRDGLGDRQVEQYCDQQRIPILAKIPFSRIIAESYSKTELLFDKISGLKDIFLTLYENICQVKHETNSHS